jgi:hypothetical protein
MERLLGGGFSVLDLDSYELHVISVTLQWVEAALRACPALRAGSAATAGLLCMRCRPEQGTFEIGALYFYTWQAMTFNSSG